MLPQPESLRVLLASSTPATIVTGLLFSQGNSGPAEAGECDGGRWQEAAEGLRGLLSPASASFQDGLWKSGRPLCRGVPCMNCPW